jgi:hypothetical protein
MLMPTPVNYEQLSRRLLWLKCHSLGYSKAKASWAALALRISKGVAFLLGITWGWSEHFSYAVFSWVSRLQFHGGGQGVSWKRAGVGLSCRERLSSLYKQHLDFFGDWQALRWMFLMPVQSNTSSSITKIQWSSMYTGRYSSSWSGGVM